MLATLPLIPVFGALVGLATRDRAERQWRAMASLSGYFLDVMRGLPTLVAFRRAEAQTSRIREVTERYRRASLETLRIAFASLGRPRAGRHPLGRAGRGHRRRPPRRRPPRPAARRWSCCCWRRRPTGRCAASGAEFHAAAEGVATFERVDELLSRPAPERALSGGGDGRPRGRRRHRHLPGPGRAGARPRLPGPASDRASPPSPARPAAASRPCSRCWPGCGPPTAAG